MTTKGPTVLNPRQKNKKYGAVVSITTTANMSSTLSAHDRRKKGKDRSMQHEMRNITRDGAVI